MRSIKRCLVVASLVFATGALLSHPSAFAGDIELSSRFLVRGKISSTVIRSTNHIFDASVKAELGYGEVLEHFGWPATMRSTSYVLSDRQGLDQLTVQTSRETSQTEIEFHKPPGVPRPDLVDARLATGGFEMVVEVPPDPDGETMIFEFFAACGLEAFFQSGAELVEQRYDATGVSESAQPTGGNEFLVPPSGGIFTLFVPLEEP